MTSNESGDALRAAAVYPVDVRSALAAGTFTPGQFDWVFLDDAVQVSADERARIEQIARVAVIDVDGTDWRVRDVAEASASRIRAGGSDAA